MMLGEKLGSIETLEVIPDPVSLIESMRAVGYSVEAAVADIIDNSLSANARTVRVQYDASDQPFVAVLDDGHGMDPPELTDAMRHGSTNPSDHRAPNDLGRFGLGLKTASLSQCRKLTVVSKKNGVVSARRWDLEVVQQTGRWLVVVPHAAELQGLPLFGKLEQQVSGTLVVWQDLDRLTAGSKDPQHEMTVKLAPLFEHLALVFHRFTQREGDHPAVTVTVNGMQLPRRDPFLVENPFRQVLEGQVIRHERGSIDVLPFILPPIGKLTPEEITLAGGREGLRGTQGFYVYRTRRLVIWGTWFRLVPKEEFYKLTRIRVDIPNSFDDLWALDIKKSMAFPPDAIRRRLKELIPHFANASRRTVTYKGRRKSSAVEPIWLRIEPRHGVFRYEPNPDHPLIRDLAKTLDGPEQKRLQAIMYFLGAAIPFQDIYSDMCGDHRGTGTDATKEELIQLTEDLLAYTSLGIDAILAMDPLCMHPEVHREIREKFEDE